RTDVDVRVQDRAQQWLLGPAPRLAGLLSRRALRLERDLERLLLAHGALLLLLEKIKRVPPCEAPHLLQPFDRHQRRQWLAFALDDELVVAEGDPVQEVTDPLADIDGG